MPKPSPCNIFTHILLTDLAKESSHGKGMTNGEYSHPPFSFLESDGVVLEPLRTPGGHSQKGDISRYMRIRGSRWRAAYVRQKPHFV